MLNHCRRRGYTARRLRPVPRQRRESACSGCRRGPGRGRRQDIASGEGGAAVIVGSGEGAHDGLAGGIVGGGLGEYVAAAAVAAVTVKAQCITWLAVKALASSLLLSKVYVQAILTSLNVNEPLVPVNLGGIRKGASRTFASGSVKMPLVWVTS